MNENALNANVGLKLRGLRLQRNIKQADAARDLGVSPAYLNLIEKGKRVMPFPLLWKALRYFEQDPEQFMATLGEGRVDEALAKLLDEPLLKTPGHRPRVAPAPLRGAEARRHGGGALQPLQEHPHPAGERAGAARAEERRARTAAGTQRPGVRFDYSPFDEVTRLPRRRTATTSRSSRSRPRRSAATSSSSGR